MRLLLFGATGQLGWELQRSLAPLGELTALERRSTDWPADFDRPHELADTVRGLRPDVVVNAAACNAVDGAESAPEAAARVNAEAPGVLAREAAAIGATLVHFGTEHIFDGRGDEPFDEDAPTAPVNAYGRSKLLGEEAIRAAGVRHLILRTGWLHAPRGDNFIHRIAQRAMREERVEVVDDQFGAPTAAELLADVTAHALRALVAQPSLAGTYHVAAAGSTSRFALAAFIVDGLRRLGRPLRLAPDGLRPVSSDRFPLPARRPANSRLATGRLQRTFGLAMPDWRAGVLRTLTEAYGERR